MIILCLDFSILAKTVCLFILIFHIVLSWAWNIIINIEIWISLSWPKSTARKWSFLFDVIRARTNGCLFLTIVFNSFINIASSAFVTYILMIRAWTWAYASVFFNFIHNTLDVSLFYWIYRIMLYNHIFTLLKFCFYLWIFIIYISVYSFDSSIFFI